MASRASTRGLTTRAQNKISVTGLKVNNENSYQPLAASKGSSSFLRDTTNKVLGLKRKADSITEEAKTVKKRSAFGDITNAIEKKLGENKKGVTAQKAKLTRATSTRSLQKLKVEQKDPQVVKKGVKKVEPAKKNHTAKKDVKPEVLDKEVSFCDSLPSSQDTVFSHEANRTDLDDSAAYVTASEGSPLMPKPRQLAVVPEEKVLPEGVHDFDRETEEDPVAVAMYADDIFKYYKEREKKFPISKYMDRQPDVSKGMRAILVDWMVEVQESFELNHETLYLAVKLVDIYLSKVVIQRDILQLLGSTAMFIACKFDERTPPYVDDFLYICDDAYNRKQLIKMEIKMLKVVGYDLGVPLSYRFLRRYARCAKVSLEDLTFTRYILELSLMEYELIDTSDSALAAAALLLARAIKGKADWNPTLQYYSGYTVDDLYHLTQVLHNMLNQPHKDNIKTIRNKYSHEIFYEVAKTHIPEKLNI